jgi:hypothetical protein
MRSADAADAYAARIDGTATEPFAARLGGVGPGGRERLHYPDLVLVGSGGTRIAVELELTPKSRTRRDRILAGYAADRRIDGVIYLVERRSVGNAIERSSVRLGLGDRVRIQPVRWGRQAAARREPRVLERSAARPAEAGR